MDLPGRTQAVFTVGPYDAPTIKPGSPRPDSIDRKEGSFVAHPAVFGGTGAREQVINRASWPPMVIVETPEFLAEG